MRASASGAYYNAELLFNNTSSAGGATIFVNPGGSDIGGEDGDGFGAVLDFLDSSTAESADITVVGGPAGVDFGSPPYVFFTGTSTAGNATINGQGGTIDGGVGAPIQFLNTATAAMATSMATPTMSRCCAVACRTSAVRSLMTPPGFARHRESDG